MQQIRPEDLLILDIETVSQFAEFCQMPLAWQQLWEEKVQRILPENLSAAAFYPLRAGVMAEFSKIVCISLGYFIKEQDDLGFNLVSFSGDDEKKLLVDFIENIPQLVSRKSNWSFAGHNIKEFDIPFICRRLIVQSICLPPWLDFQNRKPWETNLVDSFQYWRFGDYKHFTTLKLLAATMGVPSPKDDIDGSMVGEVYWKENDLQRIVKYCEKDVVTTTNILLRFMNLPLVEAGSIQKVKLLI